jgi:hypothetical protein
MSCAYRSHRYRASVTARPASVSWNHAHHPPPLRPPVVHPHRQAVLATADDAPIPVSLVQYLWAQWHQAPPEDRESVARLVGTLMRSPRWHWDVTVLPEPSLTDPPDACVSERAGRPTIGMPIAMLRMIWKQVLADLNRPSPTMAPIMQRFVSITDRSLWQEFWQEVCAFRNRARRPKKRFLQRELYGYLSPQRLPAILPEIRRLLRSNESDDRYTALTVLTRWLASPDHATRTVAAQMLHESTPVVTALVRSHLFDAEIHAILDRLVSAILTATHPEDRAAWVTTLWEVVTDPSRTDGRRQMSADALKRMMIHDPMVAALVRARLRTVSRTHPSFSAPVWNTGVAGEVLEEILDAIEQAIRQDRNAITRFAPLVATGWGTGHDQRILQIITSHPSPWWEAVLTQGITTSVGEAVCARIQSWFSPDQAMALIMNHIHAREEREDWPLAPLPAYLIPWVDKAARTCPYRLHPTTVRRLWPADPKRAWDLTKIMLDSDHPTALYTALTAMDAGWGTGYDAEVATTLRSMILGYQNISHVVATGTATAVAGIGIAPPSLIAALLTELAMKGNQTVRQQLISALHRGWGRGQDALVLRIVEMITERDSSKWVWIAARATLTRTWDHLPPHVVVSLFDRVVTRGMRRRYYPIGDAITACAPGWIHLPTALVIERIAHHVAHLHAHARTLDPTTRDTLVAFWASVIAAGADRLSAADIHAVLDPLWGLSPDRCLDGVVQGVRR